MLHAHLVFVVKYRRRVITRRVFDLLRRSIAATARALDVSIEAVEADGDHLHLMIQHPPRLALSEIVRRLKGASSHFVRKARLPEVLRRLWGRAFWSPSYFVVSCGGAPLDVVRAYVENQQKAGRTRPQKTMPGLRPGHVQENPPPYPRTEVRGLRAGSP